MLTHKLLLLVALVPSTAAAQPSSTAPAPASVAVEPATIGFMTGGVRLWTAGGDTLSLAGIEGGVHAGAHVALTVDYATNLDHDSFELHLARAGARVVLGTGKLRP